MRVWVGEETFSASAFGVSFLTISRRRGAEINAVLLLSRLTKSFLSNGPAQNGKSPREWARQRTEVSPEGGITTGNDGKRKFVLLLKQEVESFIKCWTYVEA